MKHSDAPVLRDDGQSLVIVVIAMFVVVAISAFAIDVASWYQRHHQAQVSADAAALGAANCLAQAGLSSSPCTSQTDTTDAAKVATTLATDNSVTIPSGDVTFNTSNKTVTVTTAGKAPVTFAGVAHLAPSISARAAAGWTAETGNWTLFADNQTCGSNLGLVLETNGGGNGGVTGMHSNGSLNSNDHSGAVNYDASLTYNSSGQPICGANGASGSTDSWDTKNMNVSSSGTSALALPECFNQPGSGGDACATSDPSAPDPGTAPSCTYSAPYFTTSTTFGHHGGAVPSSDQISAPGTYCVTSGVSGTCTQDSDNGTPGTIYVGTSLNGSSGYEFVGPCITLAASGTLTAPTGQPLIYGTANTAGTGTTDVFLDPGNNVTMSSAIYDPNGTVELAGNKVALTGFVEAANIIVDKNSFSTFTGNGPASGPGGDGLTE